MRSLSTAGLLCSTLLASRAAAFKVYLYQGTECNDDDGSQTLSLANDQCYTEFAGVAASAIIEKEDSDGDDDSVAFWSGKCEGDINAEGNEGCLTFFDYGGFNVISSQQGKKRDTSEPSARSVPNYVEDPAGYLRSDDPRYIAAILDDEANDPSVITHGKEEFVFDATHKWWQRAFGIYTAIPIEDWDDAIHVQNTTHLTFGRTYPYDFSEERGQLFDDAARPEERDLIAEARSLSGACQVFKDCAVELASQAHSASYWTIYWATPYAVNAYSQLSGLGVNVWNFIVDSPGTVVKIAVNNPYSSGIATGIAVLYIGQKLISSPQKYDVEHCSVNATQAATIVSTLTYTVTQTEDIQAIQAKLYPPTSFVFDGQHTTLKTSKYPISAQVSEGSCTSCYGGQCGVQTNTRRSLLHPLAVPFKS